MKRKIYDSMRKWKEENGRTALLIDGARRVGKSYILKDFVQRHSREENPIDHPAGGVRPPQGIPVLSAFLRFQQKSPVRK